MQQEVKVMEHTIALGTITALDGAEDFGVWLHKGIDGWGVFTGRGDAGWYVDGPYASVENAWSAAVTMFKLETKERIVA